MSKCQKAFVKDSEYSFHVVIFFLASYYSLSFPLFHLHRNSLRTNMPIQHAIQLLSPFPF